MINIDLPFEVGIPATYVTDKTMRLKLYRRLADLHDMAEIEALEEEFTDRFGKPTQEVLNLLYQLKVKVLAEQTGISSINVENKQLALRFPAKRPAETERQFPMLGGGVRTSKNTVWLSAIEDGDWQTRLVEILEALRDFRQEAVIA